jgi:hypothetical protein
VPLWSCFGIGQRDVPRGWGKDCSYQIADFTSGAIRPALGPPTVTNTASPTSVSRAYANLPLGFEPNRGQVNTEAKYVARGDGYTLFLTPHEAALLLKNHPPEVQSSSGAFANRASAAEPRSSTGRAAVALSVELLGANAAPLLIGAQELPEVSNYFVGNDPAKWRTNIPNYRKVTERETFTGIDTVYYGTQRQLEYDFVVAPGVDPRLIQFAMNGAEYLRTDAQGDLLVGVPGGEVYLHKPVAYQDEASGAREEVAANYVLTGGHRVTFKVGNYSPARPLIIDPILSYSTYLGGSNIDRERDCRRTRWYRLCQRWNVLTGLAGGACATAKSWWPR